MKTKKDKILILEAQLVQQRSVYGKLRQGAERLEHELYAAKEAQRQAQYHRQVSESRERAAKDDLKEAEAERDRALVAERAAKDQRNEAYDEIKRLKEKIGFLKTQVLYPLFDRGKPLVLRDAKVLSTEQKVYGLYSFVRKCWMQRFGELVHSVHRNLLVAKLEMFKRSGDFDDVTVEEIDEYGRPARDKG